MPYQNEQEKKSAPRNGQEAPPIGDVDRGNWSRVCNRIGELLQNSKTLEIIGVGHTSTIGCSYG